MKLTFEDKKQMIELRKSGWSWPDLSKQFQVNRSNLKYLYKLAERHGTEFLRKGKNNSYSPELKQELIDKVLIEGQSINKISLEYGLPN